MKLNKVIVWGHELHSHTHSYIHYAFSKSFKHMGFETHWLSDTESNMDSMDFSNSLFIVHDLVCKYLPLKSNSIYILHNVEIEKLDNNLKRPRDHFIKDNQTGIQADHLVYLQVFTKDCIDRDILDNNHPYHYYLEPPHSTIYFPWATDLLPDEIDKNIEKRDVFEKDKDIYFVGFPNEAWTPFVECCQKNAISFHYFGGTFDVNSQLNKSPSENMELIQKSIMAPAIQTNWQVDVGYIPCRIFKNISYGKMGMTNSETVNDLFGNRLLYSKDTSELFLKGLTYNENPDSKLQGELMEFVRDHHTYVNRCQYILDYLEKYLDVKWK